MKTCAAILLIISSLHSTAQQPLLYGSFGWHRIWYTKSTIHFKDLATSDFDFKLIKAKAIDDNDINVGKGIDAPQWSGRVGYIFNKKNQWGLEVSYEHAKYVLKQGQTVRLRGMIDGKDYDLDTIVHRDFIEYEHTDGANYVMINWVKRKNLRGEENPKHDFDLLFKLGAWVVHPKTNSKIMGKHYDQRYHFSGYVAGTEASLRYELVKNLLAELSLKTVYANYTDVLLYGEGRASQDWFSAQVLFTIAYQIRIN